MRHSLLLLGALVLTACSAHTELAQTSAPLTKADGAAIWSENCEGCHGIGIAGAPVAGSASAWMPRISKGREALYQHALEGFYGPKGTMMPPRGGNDALSDEEVKAAVDHMIGLVE
ncbi:MAG: cytochrome c5 family protein [Pseudomonadales bacterium]